MVSFAADGAAYATAARANFQVARFLLDDCLMTALPSARPSYRAKPTGQIAEFKGGRVALETQVAGYEWIRRGIVRNEPTWKSTGWKALDWGLTIEPGRSFDSAHQVTRLLEATATALALDESARTSERLLSFSNRLDWLVSPKEMAKVNRRGVTFTHRMWMRASLLAQSAQILKRPALAVEARKQVAMALKQQTPEGIFPERGGGDVGYQIFGMLFLLRWAATVGPSDPDYPRVIEALNRGLHWYEGRVSTDGRIDAEHSTRIGRERGHSKTGFKEPNYGRTIEVLLGASTLTGNPRWVQLARKVANGGVQTGRLKPSSLTTVFDPGAIADTTSRCTHF